MVGGGPGAFIGAVHRQAAALDGEMELVAGAFSSDPGRSREQGRALGLDPERVYGSFEAMAASESGLPADERIQVVAIVTPNHLHYPAANAFLEAGIHVVCDKPMTTTLADAEALCRTVAERQALFVLTHNYTGYPMVKEARHRVTGGEIGAVRKVVVQYNQGWLSTLLEATGHKQAAWRTDPEQAGLSSALGDIGSHAENLVRYVTGLEIEAMLADLSTLVEGRKLEDDANLLLHYRGGARGVLVASQVSFGEENALRLQVYGTEGALEWEQEHPSRLQLVTGWGPRATLTRGQPYLSPAAQHASRLPPGHPEGFIEAFANLYRGAARCILARATGRAPDPLDTDLPTVQDGARGVRFIESALESARERGWVDCAYAPPA